MSVTITPKPTLAHDPRPDLRRKAEELEAAFLSEMLGHTGLGSRRVRSGAASASSSSPRSCGTSRRPGWSAPAASALPSNFTGL